MSTYRLVVNGTQADNDLYTQISSLEVEENADLPGAIQIHLPVDASSSGDLIFVSDDRFKPFSNLAVVATPTGGSDECIFDGYVLSHKLQLKKGTTDSSLQ